MRKLLLLLVLWLSVLGAQQAAAQYMSQRVLPSQGERGTTGERQPLPYVQIGSKVLRLAPGGVIYDQQNRTIVQGQLPPSADILYTKNQSGDIQRIYILTEQEKAILDRMRKR